MSARILIVEDDPTLRLGLEDAFTMEGYDTTVAADGGSAEELLYSRHFDLVVLDIMLPGRGGLEILRGLREHQLSVPVILLTARSDENDRVLGLELGADDYVTKPFSLRELLARMKGLLRKERRLSEDDGGSPEEKNFKIGEVEIDLAQFCIRKGDLKEAMTPKEAAMLVLLKRESGAVVSRARFLNEVWGGGESVTNRTVDTHVLNLRRKIENDPKNPQHILTVHGAGYRLELTPDLTSS
ncbi:MAG: response regulator transcription factor [Planctomycetota bacterium]